MDAFRGWERVGATRVAYCFRIFWALMRRRIRFLRHFHRMWPRFFQTREERFIL